MGRSPLTTDELKLEKIVEKIKFSPTVQGIAILKDFYNRAIEDATGCDEDIVEWENETYLSVSSILKLKK